MPRARSASAGVLRHPFGIADTSWLRRPRWARPALPPAHAYATSPRRRCMGSTACCPNGRARGSPSRQRAGRICARQTHERGSARRTRTPRAKHICLRPFNVVGARQSRFGGFVLPTFVQQALAGLPITVFSDGGQTRAFLDVQDLVDFIVAAASSQHAFRSTCFNVGNPANSCSILELAQRTRCCSAARRKSNSWTRRRFTDRITWKGRADTSSANVERALALGWRPRRSLDEMILAVAEHYRVRRDMRNSDARDNDALAARHSPARR